MSDYTKTNPESIQNLFGTIADRYDKGNSAASFGMHHLWNQKLVDSLSTPSTTHLDLCSGTGEIALRYLKNYPDVKKIILLDFCKEMLEVAKPKFTNLKHHELEFVEADAQKLPLPAESVNSASMAYGLRNIKNPALAIQEAFRVLKPNGTLGILELTRPRNKFLRFGHHLYLTLFLPLIGKFMTQNKQAYRYLCDSIHHFVEPKEMVKMLQEAGFTKVEVKPLFFGTATLLTAKKT